MIIDDLARFRAIDAGNMLGAADRLPDDLEQAFALGGTLPLAEAYSRITRIVVCGVNEAALAGEVLAVLAHDLGNVPIAVNTTYDLPAYADGQSTLIVLLDHDGNSEEVLSACELADQRGTKRMVITGTPGGKLAESAARTGVSLWQYTHPGPARAAFGCQLGLLLAFFNRLQFLRDIAPAVAEAIRVLAEERAVIGLESPPARNPAKRLAMQMIGRLPFIYGAGIMAPVARRWSTQIAQNAKMLAFCDELPALDHHRISGLSALPSGLRIAAISLASALDGPRIRARQEATRLVFMMEGFVPDTVTGKGASALAQMLSALHFGDYLSCYLAVAREIDPTPTPAEDEIREKLANARL